MRVISLVLCCLFSGCVLVPIISSVREVGMTRSHRMEKLSQDLKEFQAARYWDNLTSALEFVGDEQRVDVKAALQRTTKDRKVVDSKVKDIAFSTDAFEGDVEIMNRVYDSSTLIVKEVFETQHWIFSLANGWKLTSIKEKNDAVPTGS